MFVAHAEHLRSLPPTSRFLHHLGPRALAFATIAVERLFQAICGLGGHTLVTRFEPTRMSLHCLHCGHNTPGWTIGNRA
jgi:hypothetical protein